MKKNNKLVGLLIVIVLIFSCNEEFMRWYNDVRPHRSLRFDELETPHQAFIRKMKAEV